MTEKKQKREKQRYIVRKKGMYRPKRKTSVDTNKDSSQDSLTQQDICCQIPGYNVYIKPGKNNRPRTPQEIIAALPKKHDYETMFDCLHNTEIQDFS